MTNLTDISISNIRCPKTKRAMPNQFVIINKKTNIEYFQSYTSIVGKRLGDCIVLDKNIWDYSRTTTRWLCVWLGCSVEQLRKDIEDRKYPLIDLNK